MKQYPAFIAGYFFDVSRETFQHFTASHTKKVKLLNILGT